MPVKLNTIGLSIDGVEHQVLVSAAKKRGVNIGQVIVDILFVVLNENMVDAVLDDQS